MATKKKTVRQSTGAALVVEMTEKRLENRISLRRLMVLIKAQYATIWRWENGTSIPNTFHIHQIKKWLGYL